MKSLTPDDRDLTQGRQAAKERELRMGKRVALTET